MSHKKILYVAGLLGLSPLMAQNDLDAIRYSRPGVNGTSRFQSMGGAFGAAGADLSCASYNPAGLAVFRKGEISFSGALKLENNVGRIYGSSTANNDASFVFNNFGVALAWNSDKDPESRHALAFTNTQLQNFNNSMRMEGYTNNSSIGKDMATLANYAGNVDYLAGNYEYMGYQTYLLDSTENGFVSLVDPRRSVKQSRDLVTKGRQNELNFSYAYTHKDKYYIGVSLGLPRISYESTMTHNEFDERDSMRIFFDANGAQTGSTYVDGLPLLSSAYASRGGFRSLSYTEYFKTTGTGFNLKIGGIARLSESFRVGAYFHTPTVYNLSDNYISSLSVTYDKKSIPDTWNYPNEEGGYFKYRLVTPARFGLNGAYLIRKLAVIAVDYEMINYSKARLGSDNISDFKDVNSLIARTYKPGHVVRAGAELNLKPVMLRAGYAMQGSPFGDSFSGKFVRHTISGGLGFRGDGRWYADIVFAHYMSSEDYFPFTTLGTKADLSFAGNTIGATVGIKF